MNGIRLASLLGVAHCAQSAFLSGSSSGSRASGQAFSPVHQSNDVQRLANAGQSNMPSGDLRAPGKNAIQLRALQAWPKLSFGPEPAAEDVGITRQLNAKDIEFALIKTQEYKAVLDDAQYIVRANRHFDSGDVLKVINQCRKFVGKLESTLNRAQRTGQYTQAQQQIEKLLKNYETQVGLQDLKGRYYSRDKPFHAMSEETLYGDRLIVEFAESTKPLSPQPFGTRRKMYAQRYGEIYGFMALKQMAGFTQSLFTPGGSWQESCTLDDWDGQLLTANCTDSNGYQVPTTANAKAVDSLMNDEGHLKLEY